MNTNTTNNGGNTTANTTTAEHRDFDTVKREFEQAMNAGGDYSAPLFDLATAVAYSVLNKCLDPQRKTAPARDAVSDNGQTPALADMKRGIFFDRLTLDNTRKAADKATRIAYNDAGDLVTETADKAAAVALAGLVGETLSDGIDLVQTAALAILEQAADHATGAEWLDKPYSVRRLSRRVYIRLEDSAAYRDEQTTPIQEVYKAVRRAVQESRAVRTDPRNGYTYIDGLTADGLDTIYYRLNKYADIGGYDSTGKYTTDRQTVTDYAVTVEQLGLTDRQAEVLRLRMQGKGHKAIATYLGVTQRAVAKTVEQIRKKAVAIGLDPADK